MGYPIELSVDEASARRDSGAQMLDVRESWEADICRIEGSFLLPMSEFVDRAGELPSRETELIVICHHGVRSLEVAMWLRSQGYGRAASMAGGIEAWASDIEPNMARY